jgi:signal transduction histidine kinase
MRRFSSRFRYAVMLGSLVLYAAASEAQAPVRYVLVLQSFNRGNPIVDQFTGDFIADLQLRVTSPLNFVQVVVGPTGFVGAPEQGVVDYIRAMFVDGRKPDLLVTIGGPAAAFARRNRSQLFPERPLLFAAVDQRYLRDAPLREGETAVAVANDFARIVDDILALLPDTRQVLVVTGTSQLAKFWRREFETDFRRFKGRLTFLWSDDLSFSDLLRRCATLPPHSPILYLNFSSDARGTAYADERVLAELHDATSAPIFAGQSSLLGHGVVGGTMVAMRDLSRTSTNVALRLLNGEAPDSIRISPQPAGPPIFDWRELRRWDIDESRLPPHSVVEYREPSLWDAHRRTFLSVVAALLIQSALIAGLLYERRARQCAETESRRNLTLAADASRRSTASVLANSMAHELGQSLSSMMHNTHALQRMIGTDRGSPEIVNEVISDIRAQGVAATQIIERHRTMLRSRQIEKRPIDVRNVIRESVALVARDMSERGVTVTVDVPSNPCLIAGDPVLLQQVLVNLIMNAMDAMTTVAVAQRELAIESRSSDANVTVSVRDYGTGVPADLLATLFTPFVTTKSHGLGIGLTIVRTIVGAHGGTIEAHNNRDGGATFILKFPASGMSELASASPRIATQSANGPQT